MIIQKIKVTQESGTKCEYCEHPIKVADGEVIEVFCGETSFFVHPNCFVALTARMLNEFEKLQ